MIVISSGVGLDVESSLEVVRVLSAKGVSSHKLANVIAPIFEVAKRSVFSQGKKACSYMVITAIKIVVIISQYTSIESSGCTETK